MNSALYDSYWRVFEAAAKPRLEAVRSRVQRYYGIACEAVEPVDYDEERGLAFTLKLRPESKDGDNNVFVELVLNDGDEAGFGPGDEGEPQVGVSLKILGCDGTEYQVTIPGNFSGAVGTSDPLELIAKVEECVDGDVLAHRAYGAWKSAFAAQTLSRAAVPPSARPPSASPAP